MIKYAKKILVLLLTFSMLLTSNIPVSASNNFVILKNFKIKYHNVIYDLSTKEDNLRIAENNKDLTVEEYFDILDLVIESNQELLIDTSIDSRALVPSDPGVGGQYYWHSVMKWFYRDSDGWNLGVKPYDKTRESLNNAVLGWNEVVDIQSANEHWTNEASLRGQYLCHFWFANNKEQWNIAPSIPNKSAFEWIGDRCN